MQFPQCVTAIECILGLTHLQPDKEGVYQVFIDSKLTFRFYLRQSYLVFNGDIGEPISFSEQMEPVLKNLLMSNMGMIYDSKDILCLDSIKGQLSLNRKLKEGTFSMDGLQKELDSFINDLATWSEIFNNSKRRESTSLVGGLPNFSYNR